MRETLRRLLAHMLWADERVLARLREAEHTEEAMRLYGHVLGAERLWYLRLQKEDWKQQKVWPSLSIDRCASLAAENAELLRGYVEKLSEADLNKPISYVNSRGESFTNTVGDILLQVALHGVHHRGQVAQALRRVGVEPPTIDYIAFVRGPR